MCESCVSQKPVSLIYLLDVACSLFSTNVYLVSGFVSAPHSYYFGVHVCVNRVLADGEGRLGRAA